MRNVIILLAILCTPVVFAGEQILNSSVDSCEHRLTELEEQYDQALENGTIEYIIELESDLNYWMDRCDLLQENKSTYKEQQRIQQEAEESLLDFLTK